MATKSHHRSRRFRRLRRVRRTVGHQRLLVLLSHTLATLLLMVVARLLPLPGRGGG
jgi:hypothetical protein